MSPSPKETTASKSATLGHSTVRPLLSATSAAHDIRGHSVTRGHNVEMSLPFLKRRQGSYEAVEDEEDSEGAQSDLQSLPTDFCDWCCKYFANPLMKVRT